MKPTPAEYLRWIVGSRVYDVAITTPLDEAPLLSRRLGNRVWLKREDLQPVFSFKIRGAYEFMARLTPEQLMRGVVAASAGNHAQGVALAARKLGADAKIVCPLTTPQIKRDAILALGACLELSGDNYDAAYVRAREIERAEGRVFVHPYDHPYVIAGQGTIGLEVLRQHPGPIGAMFVAVGGGGLAAGLALAIKQIQPQVRIFGVESDESDAMRRSLVAGRRITLPRVGTFADGVAVRTVGEEPFRIAQEWLDGVVVVSDDAICGAIKEVFEDRRAVLEPAGALAYAGLRAWVHETGARDQSLVAVACGANLNFDRLRHIAERAQIGERHEALLAISIPEQPGSFRRLCAALGERNITEFSYRLSDPEVARVFAGVTVREGDEPDRLAMDLIDSGFPTVNLTGNEMAKLHLRHMVGGRKDATLHERLFHFEFPERPGALSEFLDRLGGRWNISLFHYRNHGADLGRALVGIQVRPETEADFDALLASLEAAVTEETANPACALLL